MKMTLSDVFDISQLTLVKAGATEQNAKAVARSTVLAERDGIRSHGLLYIPIYALHVQCGKVDGKAIPEVSKKSPCSIRVNAKSGFAHPAIDKAWEQFVTTTCQQGVGVLTLHNSYNCGVLGHHAERIAEEGLVGLCFTHAPASIAPIGGKKPVIGTNPFALAVPNEQKEAEIVIDQSASTVAKSEILLRSQTNTPIESYWALDSTGNPTTSAREALKGSMSPAGGYKGFGVGLLVEIMASCLAGSVSSKDASPFGGTAGGPPSTGQCFMAFDPASFSGELFYQRINALVQNIEEQEGTRIPGNRRKTNRQRIEKEGIEVDQVLLDKITASVQS